MNWTFIQKYIFISWPVEISRMTVVISASTMYLISKKIQKLLVNVLSASPSLVIPTTAQQVVHSVAFFRSLWIPFWAVVFKLQRKFELQLLSLWQAGYNAGDGLRFFNIPGSGTHEVLELPYTSNIERPGRWMYRVDSTLFILYFSKFIHRIIVYPPLRKDIIFFLGYVIDGIKPLSHSSMLFLKLINYTAYLSINGELGSVTTVVDSIHSQTKVNSRESLKF